MPARARHTRIHPQPHIQRPFLNDLYPWFSFAHKHASRISEQGACEEQRDESLTDDARKDKERHDAFVRKLFEFFPTESDCMEALLCYNLIDKDNCPDGGRDGGMFTGQTLLHIAIVQRQYDVVEWLLEYGARIDSRAGGIFFQVLHMNTNRTTA